VPWKKGLWNIIVGEGGGFAQFPLLAPGLVGFFAIAWRRRALAAALWAFALLPILLFMKYDWYRAHFLYPVFGVSAMGLAALVELFAPRPVLSPPLPRWRMAPIVTAVTVLALVTGLVWRMRTKPDPALLSTTVDHAKVWLDDIPCDYWNPQSERWECSSHDRGGWMMTGRNIGDPVIVRGEPRPGMWFHPSPTGRWKRVVWSELPGTSVDLWCAMGDESKPSSVEIELRPRGSEPILFTLDGAGDERAHQLPISAGDGPALEVRFRASEAEWKHLVCEGMVK